MGFLIKALLYYGIGSIIAGGIMGAGFATNLGRRPGKAQLAELQRMGTYVPLSLGGIDGGLIAAADLRRPTIVYIHGRSASRMELVPLARSLFAKGYNAVLWDAKSRQISYGPREIDQIQRIVASIRSDPHVDAGRIYLVGFSLGGAMAIGAAAADMEHRIRGIVADSAYADLEVVASRYVKGFGVIPAPVAWPAKTVTFATAEALHGLDFETRNPADWARRIVCPVLLIHGKADRRIPPEHSEKIFGRLNTEKELWLVDDAGHTQALNMNPIAYAERVAGFLDKR
jgi:dipeptidyl aminopeptidase/acylaminoacyl peptidase